MKKDYQKLKQTRIDSWLKEFPEELQYDPENEDSKDYKGLTLINLLPKNKSLFIVPVKEEMVTEAGILLPVTEQKTLLNDRVDASSYFGMIIASSPDSVWYMKDGKNVPYPCGALCVYAKHRETYVRFGGRSLTMVSDFDIWGIIPDNAFYDYVFDAKGDVFSNLRGRVLTDEDIKNRENPENR